MPVQSSAHAFFIRWHVLAILTTQGNKKMHTLSRVKQSIRLFRHDLADKKTYRRNAKAWLKSVATLGDKWHLANTQKLVKRENTQVLN